jgi:pSer/pThr/pTyr-binding forkhead associated (FHA) protein
VAREPSVTAARVARDRAATRRLPEKVFAEIRYRDDSGPQTYRMTQEQISIGRGGENVWVDLPLYASDEVSREHVRIKRDPASGAFVIVDQSRNGARVNGRKLARGKEEPLPDHAEIGIAAALKLTFEAKR